MTDNNQPSFTKEPDFKFRCFVYDLFGTQFASELFSKSTRPYQRPSYDWAIDFEDQGHRFTFAKLTIGWELHILKNNKTFISNQVLDEGTPEEMVLIFHSLKAQMIIELEDITFQEGNREIEPSQLDPEPLLPNTTVRLSDWECQLILAAIQSGLGPSKAISCAKEVIHIQTTRKGGKPGDLSLLDKCKSSIDQK